MPKVTFVNGDGAGGDIIVDAEPGVTLLDVAEHHDAHVGSACGGNLACSTCHCWIVEGFDSLDEMEEAEDDILDKAFEVREESRLACQARVSDEDLVVEVTQESLKAWLDEHPAARQAS